MRPDAPDTPLTPAAAPDAARLAVPDGGLAVGDWRLCPAGRLDLPIGRLANADLSARDLLGRAAAIADALPPGARIVNGCRDRLSFIAVLCAALMRGQPAILPHDKGRDALAAIGAHYEGALLVADQALDSGGLPTRRIDLGAVTGPDDVSNPRLEPALPAAIAFTSGTTGTPKPVERTWAWLAIGAEDYWRGLGLDRLGAPALVVTVPGQHTYGLETAAMLPLRQSARVHAGHPLYPADVARALASLPAPRVLVTTPHHLDVLCRSEADFPATAQIVSATAPLAAELADTAAARFGARVTEVFGCTEVGLVGTRAAGEDPRWQTAPSLALAANETGAWVSGGHLPAPVLLDDDITPDGTRHFALGGRRGDIVKVAGNRASLEGLNRTLRAIDGVADGLVFQPPTAGHAQSGALRLAAFVVLDGRALADVEADFRARVPAPFWPRQLRAVDHIPRGPTGKVPRSALAVLEPSGDGA